VRESRRTAVPIATSSADGGVSRPGGGGGEVIVVEASGLDASEELHVIWALTESVACGEALQQVRYLQALPVTKHAIFVLYLLYLLYLLYFLYWYKKSAHTLTVSAARVAQLCVHKVQVGNPLATVKEVREAAAEAEEVRSATYADVCWRMLTYAGVCSRMLTYAHVCSRMLTYAHVCSRMLTYAHVCSRMLTYAMFTYADVFCDVC
jgi:hypothetical protein